FCLSGVENLRGVEMDGPLPAFWEAFFFSIQSFTTVGYGAISPTGLWTNVIAALDALTGLLAFAIATGLIFARFSKPRARILFSQHALIAPYHGMESFQFRIVNMRSNKIIDLSARVTMTWLERQPDGRKRRQFAALPLERDQVFLFPLNWTIVHPIDEKSPLWGKTAQDLERMGVEFLILLKGHDETYNQIVHSSSSYISEEIVWNARFQPMYYQHENGTTLEIDKIDDIKRLESRS
ncbi:MAG: ion channel, partial [Bacteroidota bacterium]